MQVRLREQQQEHEQEQQRSWEHSQEHSQERSREQLREQERSAVGAGRSGGGDRSARSARWRGANAQSVASGRAMPSGGPLRSLDGGSGGGVAGSRLDEESGTAEPAPEAFIWRGRLYVVRGVLAQWRERRAWWHDALEAEEAQVQPGQTLAAAAREQHVWRVEASPGWSFAPGVYDLAHDESARADDRWSLVRVAD
ncbi:DUF6504 family protein [Terrabacter aeriphilus]|uniref:DUF6504 family protein n=1 Tax=Terrabacter aeriphilus TaxID=515662 RepID=UPI0031E66F14